MPTPKSTNEMSADPSRSRPISSDRHQLLTQKTKDWLDLLSRFLLPLLLAVFGFLIRDLMETKEKVQSNDRRLVKVESTALTKDEARIDTDRIMNLLISLREGQATQQQIALDLRERLKRLEK